MNGFLKRSKDIPNMFWADFFLCAWVITGLIGGVIIFLIYLTGCAGGGYYGGGYVPVNTYYAAPPVPQFYAPYNPAQSPVFNPVPITSANPYGVRR